MIHLCLIVSLLTVQPYQIDDIGYEYYKPIVNNNLFRPLGWTVPDRSPKYELIATVISEDYVKAYVRETRNGRDYFVGVGDSIGDNIVQKIDRGMVRLDDNREFRAQSFGLLNVGSSRKRKGITKEQLKQALASPCQRNVAVLKLAAISGQSKSSCYKVFQEDSPLFKYLVNDNGLLRFKDCDGPDQTDSNSTKFTGGG